MDTRLKLAVALFYLYGFLTLATALYLTWAERHWDAALRIFLTALTFTIGAASYIAIRDASSRIRKNKE
jgi:hypothetical protein